MIICMECWQVYDQTRESEFVSLKCPKRGCGGTVVEIDELILPVIILLNEKGYFTENCCSGHFNDTPSTDENIMQGSGYISFNRDLVNEKDLAKLPDGIICDNSAPAYIAIRWEVKGENIFEIHQQLLIIAGRLLVWAIELPINESIEI